MAGGRKPAGSVGGEEEEWEASPTVDGPPPPRSDALLPPAMRTALSAGSHVLSRTQFGISLVPVEGDVSGPAIAEAQARNRVLASTDASVSMFGARFRAGLLAPPPAPAGTAPPPTPMTP